MKMVDTIVSRFMMPVSKLAAAVPQYPQVLLNVQGPAEREKREALIQSGQVRGAVAEGEAMLGGDGRILVRASGTEALIRVMVEAETQETAQKAADLVAASVENAQNIF